MATTTNYGWETPDDTDLVKDGASAIRTLGSSIDTTTKALNPETTVGDISYRSSTANTNTRLAIGTAGQVLTVNSSANAPEWKDSASGSNWSLLNSGGTALTGAATITVSGISGKDKLMILVNAASNATTGNSTFRIRLNADTATNYYSYGYTELWASNPNPYYNNDTGIIISNNGDVSQSTYGYVLLSGCNSSGVKAYEAFGMPNWVAYNVGTSYNIAGYYNSSSTISSVSIFSSAGNFDAGTIYVYASA